MDDLEDINTLIFVFDLVVFIHFGCIGSGIKIFIFAIYL